MHLKVFSFVVFERVNEIVAKSGQLQIFDKSFYTIRDNIIFDFLKRKFQMLKQLRDIDQTRIESRSRYVVPICTKSDDIAGIIMVRN